MQYFRNFRNKLLRNYLLQIFSILLRVDAMTQLNLLRYCRASLSLPQVVLPCPGGLLSREVLSTAIGAVNKKAKEMIASCNSCINCKWVVCISSVFHDSKRVRISSQTGNHVHHPYICGIPHVQMKLNLQAFPSRIHYLCATR